MTTIVLNTKITDVENKIPDTISLVTTTAIVAKISEIEKEIPGHAKNVTIQEFNKLTAENIAARLKPANFLSKTDFDNKLMSFNRKITSNKAKYLEVQKKLNSLTTKYYKFL